MMKKVFIYVGLLLAVSITSISALGPQPFACQSTAKTSNARFTADCTSKTLRTRATYTSSSNRYTYITRILVKGEEVASCGISSSKKNNQCTWNSNTYFYNICHEHNYSRYEN